MVNVNESTASPKAFGLEVVDAGKTTWHTTALRIAAWVEILVGASFILVPNGQSQFLFDTTTEGAGLLFARFAGVALIGLGLACLPSNHNGSHRSAARALFIFNIAATIFFASVAIATTFRGVMLCFVVMLHTLLAIALAASLRNIVD